MPAILHSVSKICFYLTIGCSLLFLSACGNSDSISVKTGTESRLLFEDAQNPLIGADGNGNMIAVWNKSTGIYTSRFTANIGWGLPVRISERPSIAAVLYNVRLAVNANGDAAVVWHHQEPGKSYLAAARYTMDTGWQSPEQIDVNMFYEDIDIAMTESGNIFIITEYGTIPRFGFIEYSPDFGWAPLEFFDTNTTSAGYPRIATDGSGNALAVWAEGWSTPFNVYAKRYTRGSGWGAPQLIASNAGAVAWTNLLFDKNGNAMAVWGQNDGSSFHTYASHFSAGKGWDPAERIDQSSPNSIDQSMTVDPGGNFHVVWSQWTSNLPFTDIYATKYSAGVGWEAPTLAGSGGTARYPKIAADRSGNRSVAWLQYEPYSGDSGDANVYANRFEAGSGWGQQQQLKKVLGGADPPELAVDSWGYATVLWSQSVGYKNPDTYEIKYDIFATRFR